MKEHDDISLMQKQINELANRLEATHIAEYIELLQRPLRIIYLNFIAGIARGLGIAIGATIVFAILLDILSRLIVLNLPIIGDFIIDLMRIVETKQGNL
ncbi:DUF5665 domain-containing protein [Anaerosinus massiliensis]|uniref:DUF5665 domain-containing protein n=1 Tax=Massilibacillus massiliensis TaxID=1806837 RepID=UPI000DA637ED|nr:DUF5665 domain-containing protein [Massilibacillus massiliensis]